MRCLNRFQTVMLPLLDRHRCHDADAKAQRDVLLNHVRIHGGKHDILLDAGLAEGIVDVTAAGEADVIGNQRMRGQFFQRDRMFERQQWMSLRNDDDVIPGIARERDQILELAQTLRRDTDVGLAGHDPLCDMFRRTLLERNPHLRKRRTESLHHAWQYITGLRVCSRNGQRTALFAGVFLTSLAQIFRFQQETFDDVQDALARLGQTDQTLAVALENFDAEFFFQLANLATYAGLRREQNIGDFSQVEAATCGFADGTQLLEIHRASLFCVAPVEAALSTNTCRRRGRTTSVSPSFRFNCAKRSLEMTASISSELSSRSSSSCASGPMACERLS